jgi:catalase-peroxidase
MNVTKILKYSVIATLVASTGLTSAIASDNKMSKPKGAVGMGKVAPNQAKSNLFWWPNQIDLSTLRDHDTRSNPFGEDFNYKEAFAKLDMAALKKDIDSVLTDSH